jgi:hypothetical protein
MEEQDIVSIIPAKRSVNCRPLPGYRFYRLLRNRKNPTFRQRGYFPQSHLTPSFYISRVIKGAPYFPAHLHFGIQSEGWKNKEFHPVLSGIMKNYGSPSQGNRKQDFAVQQ